MTPAFFPTFILVTALRSCRTQARRIPSLPGLKSKSVSMDSKCRTDTYPAVALHQAFRGVAK